MTDCSSLVHPAALVAVTAAGNPKSIGTTFGAGAGLDISDESYGRTRLQRWLSSLRYGTARVRAEWCVRVTVAAVCALCLVLQQGQSGRLGGTRSGQCGLVRPHLKA